MIVHHNHPRSLPYIPVFQEIMVIQSCRLGDIFDDNLWILFQLSKKKTPKNCDLDLNCMYEAVQIMWI